MHVQCLPERGHRLCSICKVCIVCWQNLSIDAVGPLHAQLAVVGSVDESLREPVRNSESELKLVLACRCLLVLVLLEWIDWIYKDILRWVVVSCIVLLTFKQSELGSSKANLELMSRKPCLLLQAHSASDKSADLILVSVVLESNEDFATGPGFWHQIIEL